MGTASPLYDRAGNRTGAIEIIRNITDRKRAEETLRESEERYSIVTDAAHDAIYTLTPEGVVTFVNSGCAALMGMPAEKIVGMPLEHVHNPDSAQEYGQTWIRLSQQRDRFVLTQRSGMKIRAR